MKTKKRVILILGVALGAVSLAACSAPSSADTTQANIAAPTTTVVTTNATTASSTHSGNALTGLPLQELSNDEVAALIFMREEEKLARDVYVELGDLWGLQVFANIAQSESSHMDAVLELLDRYGLDDPAGEPGVFSDPGLQALYDQLIAQGSQSVTDALVVGATIEDVDIADLEQRIAETDNEDIKLVFGNLFEGSSNHLRAFTRQLDRYDVDYEPAYISLADYEAITASSNGRGGGRSG